MRYVWTMGEARWKLPVIVEFQEGNDMATVRLTDLPMLQKQITTLKTKLSATAFNSTGEEWYFQRQEFERYFRPFLGEDIEDAVEWQPAAEAIKNRPPPKGKMVEETALEDDWLRPAVANGVYKTLEAASIAWHLFESLIADRLINQQKPVPFGIFTLYAFPYRTNWKQVMLQADLPRMRLRPKGVEVWDIPGIVARKSAHLLMADELTEFNRETKHLKWTMEVVPTERWGELVERQQTALWKHYMRRGGKMGVGYGLGETMRRLIPWSLRVYAEYLKGCYSPHMAILTGYRDGHNFTVQSYHQKCTLRASTVPVGQPICLGTALSPETSGEGTFECENCGMRTVFRFQPSDAKVRVTVGDVGESDNETDRNLGMPVPDGSGGEVQT